MRTWPRRFAPFRSPAATILETISWSPSVEPPQHACAVARELGLKQILNHPDGSLLSALGVGHADVTRHAMRGLYRLWHQVAADELEAWFTELGNEATTSLREEGFSTAQIELRRILDLRYAGTDAVLSLPQPEDLDYAAAFSREHRRLYGYEHEARSSWSSSRFASRRSVAAGGNSPLPTALQRDSSSRMVGVKCYFSP